MLSHRALQRTACTTCRLRQAIAVKQFARSRKPVALNGGFTIARDGDGTGSRQVGEQWQVVRGFASSKSLGKNKKKRRAASDELEEQVYGAKMLDAELVQPQHGDDAGFDPGNMEEIRATATKVVENLREIWGERLPSGIFDHELADVYDFQNVYEGLYGDVVYFEPFEMGEREKLTEAQVQNLADHRLLEEDARVLKEDMETEESEIAKEARTLWVGRTKEVMEQHEDVDTFPVEVEDYLEELEQYGAKTRVLAVKDVFGHVFPAQILSQRERRLWNRLYGRVRSYVYPEWEVDKYDIEGEGEEVVGETEDMPAFDDVRLAEDIESVTADEESGGASYVDSGPDPETRAHPLTALGRSGTSPSTLFLPKASFVEPLQALLSGVSKVHLSEAAHRMFGGVGLPYSASTPGLAKTMQAKPIPIDPSQGRMGEIEGDAYLAVLMPAMYATITNVLVETRRRLGTAWAENLVRKAEAGDLRILDAGGAGVGVLAVRELLRAEWERMHEQADFEVSGMAIAEAGGRLGGSGLVPPLGNAVVLTGSDALRHRSSQMLENTTFIPRIPDYVHTETAKQSGKFDIVIAPHTIYPIREDFLRRTHVENLWALLNSDGGVLVMLEKGIPRGFEAIAAAREHLLNTRIASPSAEERSGNIQEPDIEWEGPSRAKEHGMIVAPCTNHTSCPMYTGANKGTIKGRKDICHFEQRYIRPDFLQKIVNARDKNFEDVKFSYLSVMRGQDLRRPASESHNKLAAPFTDQPLAQQGTEMTDASFAGYENHQLPSTLSPFSLPRQIYPPLKRTGHVTMDLCTPAGTLERWTIPKSFSKQAYRDARKTTWGDLWALGAKTRVVRTARGGDVKKRGEKKNEKDGGEEEGRVGRKPLSKRKTKEKRRVKERAAGKKGMLLSREAF